MVESREFNPLSLSRADASRWDAVDVPTPKFLVSDLIPDRCAFLLAGDGGSGKSILMQVLATCVALGKPFAGYAVDPGPSLYVSAEDPADILHIRQDRINRALGVTMGDLRKRLFVASAADLDFTLFANGAPTETESRLALEMIAYGIRFAGIDSAALVYADSEIDRRSVTAFMRRLNMLARRTEASIGLITHTSRSSDGTSARMASGSTAWVNGGRAGLLLKNSDDGTAELSLLKANHSKVGKVKLRWTDTGVLLGADQPDGAVASIEQRRDDDLVLTEVKARWDGNLEPLSKSPRAGERFLPAYMARLGRLNQRRASSAMVRLLDAGRIVNSPRTKRRPEGLKPEEIA